MSPFSAAIEHLNEALRLLTAADEALAVARTANRRAREILAGDPVSADYSREDPVSGTGPPSGVEGTSLGRGSTGDGE